MWAQQWTIPFDKLPYKFNLECQSDWQLGSTSTCEWKIDREIEEMIERGRTVDSGMISAGDIEDDDRPTTRTLRKHLSAERPEVVDRDSLHYVHELKRKVLPRLIKIHRGLKYGVLGGVAGHHWRQLTHFREEDGSRKPAINSVQWLYRELEQRTGKPCLYLGEMTSFLDLRFTQNKKSKSSSSPNSLRIVGHLQHGEGGGATKNATVTKLERAVQGFDADFYIRGHDCQLIGTKNDQLFAARNLSDKTGAIRCRTKAMLNLGAATMGYEFGRGSPSYVEDSMMRVATMGGGTMLFTIRTAHPDEDPGRNLRAEIKLMF